MQFIPNDVATYCMGQCASMGSLLLTAGAAGKRFCLPHGRIMIHQPLAGMEGTATEILIHAEEFLRMKKELNGIYRKHTGQTLEKLEADTDRDRFMSATEGLSYGLIDKILEHQPAITKNPDAI
jgi:ATP-dependent Clp protease protease subunit